MPVERSPLVTIFPLLIRLTDPAMLPVNASSDEGANSGSNTVRVGDVRDDLPIPRAKPRYDEDPDTRLNAIASFIPAPIATIRPPASAGRGGRVVCETENCSSGNSASSDMDGTTRS